MSAPKQLPPIRIEKGIPIPRDGHGIWRSQFPLVDMEPGDSFAVPLEDESILRKAITNAQRKLEGIRFTTRKQGNGTIRCWRLK